VDSGISALFGDLDQFRLQDDNEFMPTTPEQLTRDALSLSPMERAYLAETLLSSLETAVTGQDATETEEDWAAEVARRLDRVRRGLAKGRPAEEVFRDIRAARLTQKSG
jgi:putative addiction module component (TIGR02574 family)